MDIKTMIVNNHKMVAEAFGKLLSEEPDIAVVAQAYDCGTALRLTKEAMPDVIVMAMRMIAEDGFEVCSRIIERAPRCRIIVLAKDEDRRYVANAFKAGVRRCVLIESNFEVLVEAIRNVSGNNGFMETTINEVHVYGQGQELDKSGDLSRQMVFSSRQQRLLQLLAEGKKPKEIACVLNLNHKTVEAHRRSIAKKLGLGSVEDLTGHLNEAGFLYAKPALSSREREILKFIVSGNNNKEIAFNLGISPKTVETYRRRIMLKLKLKREADLTRYAIKEGIIFL